jgi:oligopeptide transport system substrate-binding protein
MKRIILIALFKASLITMVLCFAGCSRPDKPDHNKGSTISIGISVEIASLDPQVSASIDAIKIQCALFEPLVHFDSKTNQIMPAAAESWDVSKDNLLYTFHLDPRARWSDGLPVTAADFAFSIRRLLDPALGSPHAEFYNSIIPESVVALDDYTLEISLKEHTPHFLSLMARPCAAALHEKWIREHGPTDSRISSWFRKGGFPSAGPYILEQWVVNDRIRLIKNPNYRKASEVRAEALIFYPMENPYTQENAWRQGLLDVTSIIASERISTYRGEDSIVSNLELGTAYVILNLKSDRLSSLASRLQLLKAVDRELIVNQVRRRGEVPAESFCPPMWVDYPQVIPEFTDVEIASEDIEPLEFLIPNSRNNAVVAEALQGMWRSESGREVSIIRQEWKSYLDSRNRKQFDLCLATWIGDYFDPLTFLEMWRSGSPNNFCGYDNEAFDSKIELASQVQDPQERLKILAEAERMLLEDIAILPLYHLSRVYLKSDRLRHWPLSLLNTVDYTKLEIDSYNEDFEDLR